MPVGGRWGGGCCPPFLAPEAGLVLVAVTAFLAVLGDYVPWGGRDAVGGGLGGGQSLDNTLRVVDPVDTEWILVDVRVGSLVHGYAHGTVHLWAEDGHLLATASQTCQFRNPR